MTLTPEEQKEADALRRKEEALNAQIMEDLRMMEAEEEWEEYQRAEEEELYRKGMMIDDDEYERELQQEEEEKYRRRRSEWDAYERELYAE